MKTPTTEELKKQIDFERKELERLYNHGCASVQEYKRGLKIEELKKKLKSLYGVNY